MSLFFTLQSAWAAVPAGTTIGTVDAWSPWYTGDFLNPADIEQAEKKICSDLLEHFNSINVSRYLGRLESALPVADFTQPNAEGVVFRQFACRIRVFRTQAAVMTQ
jgi:hypothetical protein